MLSRSLRGLGRINRCPSRTAHRPLRKFLGGQAWADGAECSCPRLQMLHFSSRGQRALKVAKHGGQSDKTCDVNTVNQGEVA